MTTTLDYSNPVDQLLAIPDYKGGYRYQGWSDYVGSYGLLAEHVPELIRLATDIDRIWSLPETEDTIAYAPLHAVRALGQLGDSRAIGPLLELIVYNYDTYGGGDFLTELIPQAVGLMGQAAIEPIRAFLADDASGLWPRVFMTAALEVIAKAQPELRQLCSDVLADLLANYKQIDTDLTSSLVSSLVELEAVEHAGLLEAAFADGYVDELVRGDWEDVQVELGLLAERVTPRRRPLLDMFRPQTAMMPRAAESDSRVTARDRRRSRQTLAKKKKAKRKKKRKR